jgi:L-ascorbate metabolism protein UlaG (beta-lactamase superfamily)
MVDGAVGARRGDTGADRIAFLGHATVLIELAGLRLLTDPLLRAGVAHLRRQAPMPDEKLFADLDAVLISHLHHDHLDLASLRRLGCDTPLIVPRGAGPWLAARGFASVTEVDVGEVTRVGTLELKAVRADHDARRPGGPRAGALGYLVSSQGAMDEKMAEGKSGVSGHTTAPEARASGHTIAREARASVHTTAREVYFAGDTALYPEMADLAPSLDVALVPVAGWGPKLGPGHMGPLEAAEAIALMGPKLAIPVHWGTLLPIGLGRRHRSRLPEPPRAFAEHVARLAPGVEVRILEPGRTTVL